MNITNEGEKMGKPVISSVGGFHTDETVDSFKKLWNESGNVIIKTPKHLTLDYDILMAFWRYCGTEKLEFGEQAIHNFLNSMEYKIAAGHVKKEDGIRPKE